MTIVNFNCNLDSFKIISFMHNTFIIIPEINYINIIAFELTDIDYNPFEFVKQGHMNLFHLFRRNLFYFLIKLNLSCFLIN